MLLPIFDRASPAGQFAKFDASNGFAGVSSFALGSSDFYNALQRLLSSAFQLKSC